MFTPENFYSVIYDNYADDNTMMLIPYKNGIKDLAHYLPWGENSRELSLNAEKDARSGKDVSWIVMYDQEVFSRVALTTYLLRLNLYTNYDMHHTVEKIPNAHVTALSMHCPGFPIWCHSQDHCAEIIQLSESYFSPCYYWYHAFMSRDWFRHWQWNRRLQPQDCGQSPYRFLLYAREHSGSREYRQSLIEQLRPWQSTIFYDWDQTGPVSGDYSAKIDVEHAEKTSIHIVAETFFKTKTLHLTEKIFKPIVMSQPFILCAAPGSLEYLKRYGFRTFDSIWSEDYDREPDHERRMHMIVEMIGKINSMDKDQFRRMYQQALPIVEHNRNRFYSENFMHQCWSELESNFQQARDHSRQLLLERPEGQMISVFLDNKDVHTIPLYRAAVGNKLRFMSPDQKMRLVAQHPCLRDL